MALPSAGGAATKSFVIERDLRDVIVDNGAIAVSELRSARVLRVAQNGIVTRRDDLLSPTPSFDAHVAWRAIAGPHGRIITLHQAESTDAIPTQIPGGYGSCGVMDPGPPPTNMPQLDGGAVANNATVCSDDSDGGVTLPCESGVVKSVLTVLASDGQAIVNRSFPAALPVDIAISRDGTNMAAVAPGNAFVTGLGTVFSFAPCGDIRRLPVTVGTQGSEQPIAVAFDASNDILVQTREPAELWIFDPTTTSASSISLSKISRKDTGHDIFSTQAGAMIACASCHPEGGDDGHTWLLDGKARRTPSLRGTIAGTAPYHWPGDEQNLDALVDDVYSKRMSGMPLMPDQKIALEGWVQTVPRPRAPSWIAPLAAQRGQSLFSSASIGCASCHSGDKLTNNASMDVGTGGVFQVPPLVGVGWRTPLFHDGCATTMADRFGKCATSAHGTTSALSAQDISDLTAYLETL